MNKMCQWYKYDGKFPICQAYREKDCPECEERKIPHECNHENILNADDSVSVCNCEPIPEEEEPECLGNCEMCSLKPEENEEDEIECDNRRNS